MNEEFDYLNQDLVEWFDLNNNELAFPTDREVQLLHWIRDNYLPEFEAAVWRLAAENAR